MKESEGGEDCQYAEINSATFYITYTLYAVMYTVKSSRAFAAMN